MHQQPKLIHCGKKTLPCATESRQLSVLYLIAALLTSAWVVAYKLLLANWTHEALVSVVATAGFAVVILAPALHKCVESFRGSAHQSIDAVESVRLKTIHATHLAAVVTFMLVGALDALILACTNGLGEFIHTAIGAVLTFGVVFISLLCVEDLLKP